MPTMAQPEEAPPRPLPDSAPPPAALPAPDSSAAPVDAAANSSTSAHPAPAATPASDAPSVADGVEHELDPRYVRLQRLIGWIVWASLSWPLFGVALGLTIGARLPLWVSLPMFVLWSGVCGGLAWLAQYWPDIEHRHAAYKVDDSGIQIRQGVAWRSVINVARSRVQHTDVAQGPLERRYGLAELLIYTAGTDNAEVAVHGLERASALRIRDHLLAGGGDDAV